MSDNCRRYSAICKPGKTAPLGRGSTDKLLELVGRSGDNGELLYKSTVSEPARHATLSGAATKSGSAKNAPSTTASSGFQRCCPLSESGGERSRPCRTGACRLLCLPDGHPAEGRPPGGLQAPHCLPGNRRRRQSRGGVLPGAAHGGAGGEDSEKTDPGFRGGGGLEFLSAPGDRLPRRTPGRI